VFTTVHANNVVDVIGRFLNMGVEPYNFVSALNCILAQRLVRVICDYCKKPVQYPDAFLVESGMNPDETSAGEDVRRADEPAANLRLVVRAPTAKDDGERALGPLAEALRERGLRPRRAGARHGERVDEVGGEPDGEQDAGDGDREPESEKDESETDDEERPPLVCRGTPVYGCVPRHNRPKER